MYTWAAQIYLKPLEILCNVILCLIWFFVPSICLLSDTTKKTQYRQLKVTTEWHFEAVSSQIITPWYYCSVNIAVKKNSQ